MRPKLRVDSVRPDDDIGLGRPAIDEGQARRAIILREAGISRVEWERL